MPFANHVFGYRNTRTRIRSDGLNQQAYLVVIGCPKHCLFARWTRSVVPTRTSYEKSCSNSSRKPINNDCDEPYSQACSDNLATNCISHIICLYMSSILRLLQHSCVVLETQIELFCCFKCVKHKPCFRCESVPVVLACQELDRRWCQHLERKCIF